LEFHEKFADLKKKGWFLNARNKLERGGGKTDGLKPIKGAKTHFRLIGGKKEKNLNCQKRESVSRLGTSASPT